VRGNWILENYTDGQTVELTEEECGFKKAVNIFSCNNANIVLKGKVKSIMLESCKKTNI